MFEKEGYTMKRTTTATAATIAIFMLASFVLSGWGFDTRRPNMTNLLVSKPLSPITTTVGVTAIDADEIEVTNIDDFVDPGTGEDGVATLSSDPVMQNPFADYEIVTYTGRDTLNNKLTGVTREVEGTAREWPAGTAISCFMTAEHFKRINEKLLANSPVVRLSKLPGFGNGTHGWNGMQCIQDNLWTHGDTQYAVWINDEKKPTIGKRTLPNGEWSTFDLSTITDNPLGVIADDHHNTLSVAVDEDGYIHVAGNMHNNSLRYVRSTSPNDITAWAEPGMTGVNEDSVTYPRFVKLLDGTLLLFYRNGVGAGNSNTYVNEYDSTAQTWSKLQNPLLDGMSDSEGPYLHHIAVGNDGTIHLMFCWRAGASGNNQSDLSYAKSTDGGVTWLKSDGTPYSLPITHATADIIVPTDASGSGLLNHGGLEIDASGRPHGAFLMYDGNDYTQIYHTWFDGTTWHTNAVTDFTYKWDLTVPITFMPLNCPCVVANAAGGVYIIHRHFQEKGNIISAINVTPGVENYESFELMRLNLYDWSPTFDTQALRERDELHMIFMPLKLAGSSSEGYENDDHWDKQFIGVVSYDMSQIDAVQRGIARLPEIVPVATTGGMDTPLVVSNTEGAIQAIRPLLVYDTLGFDILFARHRIRANLIDATDMNLYIIEQKETPPEKFEYGTLQYTSTLSVHKESPWIVLRQFPSSTQKNVYLAFGGYVDANTGRIVIATLQLGKLTLN
jgi:hypothetical protein